MKSAERQEGVSLTLDKRTLGMELLGDIPSKSPLGWPESSLPFTMRAGDSVCVHLRMELHYG